MTTSLFGTIGGVGIIPWLPHPTALTLNSEAKVSNIINEEGRWDLTSIQMFLSRTDVEKIQKTNLARFASFPDNTQWTGAFVGKFTVSTIYDLLTAQD